MQNWAGKRRGKRMVVMHRVVKQWFTGDRAKWPKGDIERELIEHVLHLVLLS
jgi:hypothetical protein